jgi:type I restriction enzyme S subunit
VSQNPNDQPASELLKEIEAEKKILVKEGKIKKQEPLPPIKTEEIPYQAPKGWVWVRLGNIGETNIGLTYSPTDISDIGTPVLRSNNIQNGKLDLTNLVRVNKEIKNSVMVQEGDLLICARNGSKALVGKTAQVSDLSKEMAFGAFMAIFRSSINNYVLRFIHSPLFRRMIADVSTTTINQITQNNLKTTIFPLPPLAEQKRIVAKIDQLMALCDKLEVEKNARDKKRLVIHTAAMNKLLTATDKTAFNVSWNFINKNFSVLYSVTENVEDLKKAILQLAVMGKLVPQDPNDQPASELLKEIEAEKKKLMKEGKIKKQEPLPPIKTEEIPYQLPKGWVWVKLDTVAEYIQRGKGPIYSEIKKIPVISQKCIQWSGFNKDVVKFIDPGSVAQYQSERFILNSDLLWNSTGTGTIGRINIYNDELHEYSKVVADSHVTVVRTIIVNSEYILNFLMSPIVQNDLEDKASGTTNQIELNTTMVKNQLIPLPPLAEQKRIVVKIGQLMELCNVLGQQIKDSTKKQAAILDAVLARL